MAEEPLRRPDSEWSVQVLGYLGHEESYGMLVLGETVKTIGTNLLPSRLFLCGGRFDLRSLLDPSGELGI